MSLLPATKERTRATIDFFFAQSKGLRPLGESTRICKLSLTSWALAFHVEDDSDEVHEQTTEK